MPELRTGKSSSEGHVDFNGRVQLLSNENEEGHKVNYTLGVRYGPRANPTNRRQSTGLCSPCALT
jgi:hypothetical protein